MRASVLYFIFIVACLSFTIQISGQTGTIQGIVVNEQTPLAFANVILKNAADSSIIKAEVTNYAGRYIFRSIPFKTYFVEVSYIGMPNQSTPPFNLNKPAFDIAPIRLEANATELNAVEVRAKRPLIEVMADKTVFNVQNTLNSTGTNGFELLRKAPGVIIDNNDQLILEGKTGVQIFINGKAAVLSGEDLTNYLRSLQASDIEAIEIITQPSAKYDAAGNAGIINIKLKKDKRLGTNGTLSAGYAYGKNSRYNSSLSVNTRTKKTNLFGTYSNNFGDTWDFINLDRIQQNIRYNSKTETLTNAMSNSVRLGYDIFPHQFHTFGILFNGSFYDRNSKGLTRTPISPLATQEVEQILIARNENESNNYNVTGNLNYRFADTTGHELLIDLDYGKYNRDRINFQPNEYLNENGEVQLFERNFRMVTPTTIDILTAKLDYSQNLFGMQVKLGGKYSNVDTDNTFNFFNVMEGVDEFNQDRSNLFQYTENINAGYLNISKKWTKWSMQLGLRAEQTISTGELISTQSSIEDKVDRNYLDWFPSGGLTFAPNYKSSWALTYSRRIQRPNYQTLNPFEYQIDELTFSKGNPFLQPQYTNNIKLSHTYKYRLTTSISYSKINDFFAQITDTIDINKNVLITKNIANQEVWNIGISFPFELTKWWSVYTSLNAYSASYQGQDEKFIAIDQSTLSFYGQNTFSLKNGIKLEISGWYSSPSVWGGTYLNRSMGSLDVAIQKKLLQDKLSIRLAVSDIFFTSFWRADMRFGELYIDGSGGWESRQFKLNLSYRFGNSKVKKSRKRNAGLEDEGNRVGSN